MFKTNDQSTDNIKTVTSDTNMMVEFLANSEKLKGEGERVFFSKDIESDNKYDLDDDIDSYTKPKANNRNSDQRKHNDSSQEANDYKHRDNQSESYNNKGNTSDCGYDTDEKKPVKEEEKKLTKEEENMRKLDMLRKLGELTQCGVVISDNYSMKSDYETMKYEYEMHMSMRGKRNAVNWMSGMMIGIIKGIEMLNDNMNPFDIKFDNAWSNNVRTDITNYYDALGEIYEKWAPKGKSSPELKLFYMLTASAVSIQLHKGCEKIMSGLNNNGNNTNGNNTNGGSAQTLSENPELLKELRDRATNKTNNVDEKKQQYQQNEEEKLNNFIREQKLLKEKQEEWNRIQEMATQKDVMARLQNDLMMSESAKSVGNTFSPIDTNVINYRPQQRMQPPNSAMFMQQTPQRVQSLNPNIAQQQRYMPQQTIGANSKMVQQPKKNNLQQQQQQLSEVNKMLESMKKHNPKRDTDSQSSLSINPRANEILRKGVNKPKKINRQNSDTSDDDLYRETLSIGSRG